MAVKSPQKELACAFSVPSYSDYSTLSETLIREEIRAGNLRALKCRGRYLIPRQDGIDFIENLPEVAPTLAGVTS